MKKSLLFPLSILAITALSGCTTNSRNGADVSDVGSSGAYGIEPVQPLESTQINSPISFEPTQVNNSPSFGQDFYVPRDPNTNEPIYSQIEKGSYKGDSYTVRKHDTLYFISYISGKGVGELAARNNLSAPYHLNPGQVIILR